MKKLVEILSEIKQNCNNRVKSNPAKWLIINSEADLLTIKSNLVFNSSRLFGLKTLDYF